MSTSLLWLLTASLPATIFIKNLAQVQENRIFLGVSHTGYQTNNSFLNFLEQGLSLLIPLKKGKLPENFSLQLAIA
jgi:hypothetical protein